MSKATWDKGKGFATVKEVREANNLKALDDAICYDGLAVKAAKDGYSGEGWLVVFSTEDDPDLQGDYFTSETDFGSHTKSALYWHHGLDKEVGKTEVGTCSMKAMPEGVWFEYQLDRANSYAKDIAKLGVKGKLGASSGTAMHLIKRDPVTDDKGNTKANFVSKWPLGLDASLTPCPVEPRTRRDITPIKSLSVTDANSLKALTEGMETDGGMSVPQTEYDLGTYTYPVRPTVGHAMSTKLASEHGEMVHRLMKNRTISAPEYSHIMSNHAPFVYKFHTGLNEGVASRQMNDWDYYEHGYKAFDDNGMLPGMKTVGDAMDACLTRSYNAGADKLLTAGSITKTEHEAMRGHFVNEKEAYMGALDEGVMKRDLGMNGSSYLPMKSLPDSDALVGVKLPDQVSAVLGTAEDLKKQSQNVGERFSSIKGLRAQKGEDLGPTACGLLERTVLALQDTCSHLKSLLPPPKVSVEAIKAEAEIALAKARLIETRGK